jgi:thioredoxin-like negative regulator of GroEL
MTRWLLALVAALLLIGAGYLAFLNPEPVVVHLTPARRVTPSLAVALLVAFMAGAVLVGLGAAMRASARSWRSWRAARRSRRAIRHAASTARARDLVWAGDYAQARAELLQGERKAPADTARIALLAETYLHGDDPHAARTLLEQGLTQVGLEPRLLDLLGEAAERTGDVRGATEALERARLAQPDNLRLARRLRDVYAKADRWAEAATLQAEMLLRIHEPRRLVAEEQLLRGLRYQAALAGSDVRHQARVLVGLAREDPGFVPAWVSAGDLLVRAGRPVAARRVWERGARRRPVTVLLERIAQLNENRPERTTRLYRRLRRRHPEAHALPLLLARHLIAHGTLDEAEHELSALPAALAGHPLTHALWGELHRRRGNLTLATESFQRALAPDGGLLTPFRCANCRSAAPAWQAYCATCRRWGTFRSPVELSTPEAGAEPAELPIAVQQHGA